MFFDVLDEINLSSSFSPRALSTVLSWATRGWSRRSPKECALVVHKQEMPHSYERSWMHRLKTVIREHRNYELFIKNEALKFWYSPWLILIPLSVCKSQKCLWLSFSERVKSPVPLANSCNHLCKTKTSASPIHVHSVSLTFITNAGRLDHFLTTEVCKRSTMESMSFSSFYYVV